jgi:hypothetical protein
MLLEALPCHKIPHSIYSSYQLFMLHFPFTSTSLIWLIPKIKYVFSSTNYKAGCFLNLHLFIFLNSEYCILNFAFKHWKTVIFLKTIHQVSHSYRTEGKITGLCVLKFKFLDWERWDKEFSNDGARFPKIN